MRRGVREQRLRGGKRGGIERRGEKGKLEGLLGRVRRRVRGDVREGGGELQEFRKRRVEYRKSHYLLNDTNILQQE